MEIKSEFEDKWLRLEMMNEIVLHALALLSPDVVAGSCEAVLHAWRETADEKIAGANGELKRQRFDRIASMVEQHVKTRVDTGRAILVRLEADERGDEA